MMEVFAGFLEQTGTLPIIKWKAQGIAYPDTYGATMGVAVEPEASACAEVGIVREVLYLDRGKVALDDR